MKSSRMSGLVLVAVAVTLGSLGCAGGLQRLKVADDWVAYRKSHPAPRAAAAGSSGEKVDVALIASESLIVKYAAPAAAAAAASQGAPLLPIEGKPPRKGVQFFIQDGGKVLASALRRNLARAAPGSAVKLAADGEPGQVVVTPFIVLYGLGYRYQVTLRLQAALPDGGTFVVEGASEMRSTARHWGWVAPIALVTGVWPTMLWAPAAFRGLGAGALEADYAEAADRAGAALARELLIRSDAHVAAQ